MNTHHCTNCDMVQQRYNKLRTIHTFICVVLFAVTVVLFVTAVVKLASN